MWLDSIASSLSLDVVVSSEGITALREEWQALERASLSSKCPSYDHEHQETNLPHLGFQSFDWCASWADVFAQGQAHVVYVVVVRDHGKAVLIWPLMKTKMGPFRILRWLTDPFGQYGDVLSENPEKTPLWLAYAWRHLTSLRGVDLIRLRHVRCNALVTPFLRAHASRLALIDGAPFLDFLHFASPQHFEGRFDKKQRQRRKKIQRKLQDLAPDQSLSFSLETNDQISLAMVSEMIRHKRSWLDQRGFFSPALTHPLAATFLSRLAQRPFKTSSCVVSKTSLGARGIAWEIGFRHDGVHYCFMTAHDSAFTEESPARLHMDSSQHQAFLDGMRVFDLMIPADEHKRRRSNGEMDIYDFYRPVSLKGFLVAHLYYGMARPWMQRIYRGVSPAWRKRLAFWLPKQK